MIAHARVSYAVLLSCITHVLINAENITQSCLYLYEKGVEAYLDNRFDACVVYFENALKQYKDYTKKLQNCRIKCQQEAELSDPLFPVDLNHLLFYEKTIKTTLCIVNCKRRHKETFHTFNINPETEKLFQENKPYEYLHICYFQNKEYQKAASSAFTYLASHPDDKMMSANLKHYSSLNGVKLEEVVNFEAKDFVYLYIHGADAYEKKDWQGVIENMEESLVSYLQSEEECRVLCEGPFDAGWYPDFIPAIANHFTHCLKCKQNCSRRLNSLNGEIHNDLLPSHYHYLQYAYFKTGNLNAACAAVESYLLFYSDDATMLENKLYYSKLPKGKAEMFTPRPEAVRYIQRLTYEKRILKFIATEFKFKDPAKEISSEALKYHVVMNEKQLQGSNRFVSESLATIKECRALVDIAKLFGTLGDGYEGKKSPHTIMERFTGVTIDRATALVNFGLLNPKDLKLLLDVTERARRKLIEFFGIEKELFFSYTHLVSRTPLKTSSSNRSDLSHPVHADNCIAFSETDCETESAYNWRDYSVIIYLNNDFEGGEFIFSADLNATKIQSVVVPKCGRMVGFTSGSENLHGVKAVRSGTRHSIGLWFTHDLKHEEKERIVANQMLNGQ